MTPSPDIILFLSDGPLFGFDFFAELAIIFDVIRRHDQSHTAGLTGAVLS